MPNILPVDYIDVSAMMAALVMKHSVHFRDDTRRQDTPGSPHHDTETILLRGPAGLEPPPEPEHGIAERSARNLLARDLWFQDVPQEDTKILKNWPTARTVLKAVADSHLRRTGLEPLFGKIMVVRLKPGGTINWHVDQGPYAEAYDRFHICLIPSPGAILFSGGESAVAQFGTLVYFNNRVLHSAINMGAIPRVHLILDIRKPELDG